MSDVSAGTLFRTSGLVVVITGGGTGIGLMIAKGLEENGAKVYIVGWRSEVLQEAANEAKHGNIFPLQADVTSKEDLERVVEIIAAADGFVNVLIAAAGIVGQSPMLVSPSIAQYRAALWGIEPQALTDVFRVNLISVYYTVVAFLELLHAGNERGNVPQLSQVIAIGSIGGFSHVSSTGYAYSTSKAALHHFMKMLATTLRPYRIRSNVIAPGIYPSEWSQRLSSNEIAELIPVGRRGELEDMAGLAIFLASRAGGYVNGGVLVTDGGRLGTVPSSY